MVSKKKSVKFGDGAKHFNGDFLTDDDDLDSEPDPWTETASDPWQKPGSTQRRPMGLFEGSSRALKKPAEELYHQEAKGNLKAKPSPSEMSLDEFSAAFKAG